MIRSGSRRFTPRMKRCAILLSGSRTSSSTYEAKNDSIEAITRDVRRKMLDVRLPVETLLGLADAP